MAQPISSTRSDTGSQHLSTALSVWIVALSSFVTMYVPICPPAETPPIAQWLIEKGWPEDAGPVKPVALWLHGQQVRAEVDFVGLGDIAAIPGAELLPQAAIDFLDSLVQVCDLCCRALPLNRHSACS